MNSETKTRLSAPLYAARAILMAFVVDRAARLRSDERGLETLEYALLALMGVVVLAVAINSLGGSISGLLGRIGKTINGLG